MAFQPKTPYVCADGIVEIVLEGECKGIVIIERKNPPHGYALPGGFVDIGESVEDALKREMQEELNLEVEIQRLLGIYSDPKRDPRFHTASAVYVCKAGAMPVAGDDAKHAVVVPKEELRNYTYAFDHERIIKEYLS